MRGRGREEEDERNITVSDRSMKLRSPARRGGLACAKATREVTILYRSRAFVIVSNDTPLSRIA